MDFIYFLMILGHRAILNTFYLILMGLVYLSIVGFNLFLGIVRAKENLDLHRIALITLGNTIDQHSLPLPVIIPERVKTRPNISL